MDNQTIEKYKYDHIESHLNYWLDNNNMTFEQAYEKYEEEIHDIVFNTDYFIIGYYKFDFRNNTFKKFWQPVHNKQCNLYSVNWIYYIKL